MSAPSLAARCAAFARRLVAIAGRPIRDRPDSPRGDRADVFDVPFERFPRDPVAARARGMDAESIACRTLRRNGWRILGRNVRVERDELDVLALEPDERTLVVVEVKTARTERDARSRLDRGKRRRLARARRALAREVRSSRPIRVDLVVVVDERVVRHVRGVSLAPPRARTVRLVPAGFA